MRRITWKTCAAVAILVAPLVNCAGDKPEASTEPIGIAARSPAASAQSHRGARAPARGGTRRGPDAAQAVRASGARGARTCTRLRQGVERQPRHLVHDVPPAGVRDGRCDGDSRSDRARRGIGPDRVHPQGILIPRNAPAAFNLAAMQHLFWDGRVERMPHGGISTPAGNQVTPRMQRVFEFGPVSAIGMFPVGNRDEMRAYHGQRARRRSTMRTTPRSGMG